MKKLLLFYLVLVLSSLLYGMKVPQKNSEELFLSDDALVSFQKDQALFGTSDPVVVTGLTNELEGQVQMMVEEAGGEYVRLHPKKVSEGLITLPPLEDVQKYQLFQLLHSLGELQFAGGPYTNAELAGMSLKIQEQLFPMLFAVVFIALILLVRNFQTTLYLFLSSLLGAGVGLTLVRLFYGTSTILTTLTPLVGFVLTLGVQLHVVYGLAVAKDLPEFWGEKRRPLLIMMVTTLVGFYSLLTSDLAAVRQLALTSGTTLLLTWTLNLLLLRWGQSWGALSYAFKNNMQTMKPKPLVGWGLILIATIVGVVGINQMPKLVEALYFFPTDHRIHTGAEKVGKLLGGTPQFEVLIKRVDQVSWSYADTQKMAAFEADHPLSVRRLSAAEVVKTINLEYAGESKLPDVEISFTMLLGRAPSVLGSSLKSEAGYKWIILSKPERSLGREKLEKEIEAQLKLLPAGYEARLGGITYWLLKSQGHLITSLIKSVATSLVFIVLMFIVFERRPKKILVFTALNVASILGGFALMSLLGFELNVSSVMTASIALGMVVDSTIHLMFLGSDEKWARATYNPIVLSHIVLFVAFGLLAFEPFVPIRDFALGLVMLLGVGLIFDLWVLPLIEGNES